MVAYADVSGAQVASDVLTDLNDQMDARGVPMGGIIMWSGLIANIPDGYKLCNGGSGAKETTPDLSNRFIMGSDGTSVLPGATGGTNSKTLSISEIPAHTHGAGTYKADTNFGSTYKTLGSGDNSLTKTWEHTGSKDYGVTGTSGSRGSGNAFDNRPAFYVLAFIKRED